jgi:hypothetical protein
MNCWTALLCIPLTVLSANGAAVETNGIALPMRYEGGTLPLGQGKTQATISENKVVFTQGHRKLAIPLQNITTISCNTDIRRRFGAPVLGAVPRLHLDMAEVYYVGLTWTGNNHDGEPAARIDGVFKLSASEYYNFLTTLERLTGKKAVDTHRVPAVVRYGL